MTGFAEAIAYGAATIVNAISIDKGAAFGVDLYTRARVTLTSEPGHFSGHITSDPSENDSLIRASVLTVLRHFGAETRFGAEVETDSNIPIARGLKSSSAAANALVLATIGALDNSLDDESTMALSVDAAVEAKTTITGAYDDTCASFLGGIVVTNNSKRALLKV
ncbi:MAG: shikimate kinase, partial [Candidatus Bathyarchaeia archaeon]